MNKPVFYIIFLLFSFNAKAQQNLVPNGSFEEYWQCPVGNDLNDGQFERCKYWWKPTMGTSDYYNTCNTGIVGVPNNFWGYQNAFHGNAYVGFGAITWDDSGNTTGNEYIRTELKQPLKHCYIYKLTMYVSLAEVSTHGVGKLAAWFSEENNYLSTMLTINENPQIINESLPIIDTSKWVKIEGTFIASGIEKYLTIGYFNNNVNQDTLFVQDFGFESEALYYLDSVSLIEIGSTNNQKCLFIDLPNVFSPNNDGVNDFYDLSIFASYQDIDFSIINRWGNVVFEYNSGNQVWNGNDKNGNKCSDGVYYYILNTDIINKTGFIQLIR